MKINIPPITINRINTEFVLILFNELFCLKKLGQYFEAIYTPINKNKGCVLAKT